MEGAEGGVPPLAGAGLYMRARRYRRCTHARARETGNKTHHGPPVAPPDRAWCVLFRVSLAHVAMYYRCRGLLGGCAVPSSASKVSRGWEKSIPYTKIHARRGYAVHQRRAKPMMHAARAAKNTKQIGRRPSRCDIGAVRVRWHPHFSPGASRSSIHAARPQISLLSQNRVFSRNHGFRGGGKPHTPGASSV